MSDLIVDAEMANISVTLNPEIPLHHGMCLIFLQKICKEVYGDATVESDEETLVIPVRSDAEEDVRALVDAIAEFWGSSQKDSSFVVDKIIRLINAECKQRRDTIITPIYGRRVELPLGNHCTLLVYIATLVTFVYCKELLRVDL